MTNLILNCALYVILSSALPLLVKVYPVLAKRSSIKDLVLLRTKLLKWSFFGPFFYTKVIFYTKVLFCREMCNIVNTRFLRPFGDIMEITTKSP